MAEILCNFLFFQVLQVKKEDIYSDIYSDIYVVNEEGLDSIRRRIAATFDTVTALLAMKENYEIFS